MGNKHGPAQFKSGSVLITIDNQHYSAGQKITGTVSYVLEKPFPADKFTLELTGKEHLVWEGHDDKHKNSKYPGKICMKQTALRISQVLTSFPNGEAPVGKQSYPFSIQLPTDIPPSFFYLGKDSTQMRITYKLTARMGRITLNNDADSKSDSKVATYLPLLNKRLLVVSQPPEKINFNVKVVNEHANTSFGIKKGTSKIEVHLEKDAYQPQEAVKVRVVVDNTASEQAIKEMKVKLYRQVRAVSANNKEFVDKFVLVKRKLKEEVGPKVMEEKIIEMALGQIILNSKELESFRHSKKHIAAEMSQWLTTLQHSIKTATIECKYFIEIEFKNSGAFSKDMPKMTVPLNIYYQSNVFEDIVAGSCPAMNAFQVPVIQPQAAQVAQIPSQVQVNPSIPSQLPPAPVQQYQQPVAAPVIPTGPSYYPSFDVPMGAQPGLPVYNQPPINMQNGAASYNYTGSYFGQPFKPAPVEHRGSMPPPQMGGAPTGTQYFNYEYEEIADTPVRGQPVQYQPPKE